MNNDFKNILRAFINNFKALKFYIHSVEEFLFSYQEKSNEKHGEELLAIMYADYIANASDNQHFLDFLTEQRNVSINALNNQLDIHDAKQMDEKLDDYFKNKIKKNDTIDDGLPVIIEKNLMKKLSVYMEKSQLSTDTIKMLYESMLISSVIYFENLVSNCLQTYINLHPEIISVNDKNLSFSELKLFKSIEDAEYYLVEREVQELMYNSFDGWYIYLRNKIKLNLDFMNEDKDKITDIFQVRNIFVHNGGYINKIFLNNIKNMEESYNIGERIVLTKEYILSSTNILEKQGILLLNHLWRKVDKKNAEGKRTGVFFDIAFNKMENEEWGMASKIFEELSNESNLSNEDLLINKINYLQCLKWDGKIDELKNELAKFDFSGYQNKYKIALFILMDKYDEAINLLPKAIAYDELTIEHLETWPLFREARKQGEFANYIQSLHITKKNSD